MPISGLDGFVTFAALQIFSSGYGLAYTFDYYTLSQVQLIHCTLDNLFLFPELKFKVPISSNITFKVSQVRFPILGVLITKNLYFDS